MSGSIAVLFYDERRERFRWQYGNETFYDDENRMVEFVTIRESIDWLRKEYPEMSMKLPAGLQFKMLGASDVDQLSD